MSRYEIPARKPGHKVIVGWDHPLMTYFIQVIDVEKQDAGMDDYLVVWMGTSPHELYDLDRFDTVVARHATLTTELRNNLYRDKDEGL